MNIDQQTEMYQETSTVEDVSADASSEENPKCSDVMTESNDVDTRNLVDLAAKAKELLQEADGFMVESNARLAEAEARYKNVGNVFIEVKKWLPSPLVETWPAWLSKNEIGIGVSRANDYIRLAKGMTSLAAERRKFCEKNQAKKVRATSSRNLDPAEFLGRMWIGPTPTSLDGASIATEGTESETKALFVRNCLLLRNASHQLLEHIGDVIADWLGDESADQLASGSHSHQQLQLAAPQ